MHRIAGTFPPARRAAYAIPMGHDQRSLVSVGHQHRNGHVFEHVPGHPAQDKLAPPRMAVGPHDNQVRAVAFIKLAMIRIMLRRLANPSITA